MHVIHVAHLVAVALKASPPGGTGNWAGGGADGGGAWGSVPASPVLTHEVLVGVAVQVLPQADG